MRQLMKGQDRKLLGVASGVADYFDMDQTVMRAITVLGCVVFPPLVLAYFVLGMVIPDNSVRALPPEGGPAFTPTGEPGAAPAGKRTLTKSRDRWLTGVAGGTAEYFRIDPTIVRALFLGAFFFFGTGVLVYAVLSVVMPGPEAIA